MQIAKIAKASIKGTTTETGASAKSIMEKTKATLQEKELSYGWESFIALHTVGDLGIIILLVCESIRQTKIHNIGATLVGVDKFGNKYFQKLENTQYGRHRWVEYASKDRYNASQVPPEWHGWLHFVTDHTGDELLMLKPKRYGLDHKENSTGEGDEYIYHSKGHTLHPGQRDWTRYQSWQPTKTQ